MGFFRLISGQRFALSDIRLNGATFCLKSNLGFFFLFYWGLEFKHAQQWQRW